MKRKRQLILTLGLLVCATAVWVLRAGLLTGDGEGPEEGVYSKPPPIAALSAQTPSERVEEAAAPEGRWGPTETVRCAPSRVELWRRQQEQGEPSAAAEEAEASTAEVRPQCCAPVAGDIDQGRTLAHLIARLLCREQPNSLGSPPTALPLRVMQVGANTGDNMNDHLVRFLRLRAAHAVLLEPVPWIFRRLQQTYAGFGATVQLRSAAMTPRDGNVSFTAPRENAIKWIPQMGGLELPPSTMRKAVKQRWLKFFERITVEGVTFATLLEDAGWGSGGGRSGAVVDVFVVDAEGFDAAIVDMVLDEVLRRQRPSSRTEDDPGARSALGRPPPSLIPLLQFEWKHLPEQRRAQLHGRLRQLGYCVMQVHYDDIAYLPAPLGLQEIERCSDSFALSTKEKRTG